MTGPRATPDSAPESTRRRSYVWDDPRAPAAAHGARTGLEMLEAMASGELAGAPIAATLGMTVLEVEDGRVVFGLTPEEWHYNPIGSVHGGVHATLLDSAMSCAVHSRLAAGQSYTTLDMTVRYLRPVSTGTLVSFGSRVATAEGTLTDSHGKLVATGSTTCLVMSPSP
jgi:uncharacterized protein (TIGR00369 family)